VPTTARFFNAPDGKTGRARFSTALPASADADGGVSVGWTARYGYYAMTRAPVQIAVTDTGQPQGDGGTEYNAYIRVQYGSIISIRNNSGGTYADLLDLDAFFAVGDLADGRYHQWSCAVVSGGGMAHWKLWVDGVQLFFYGANGEHEYNGEWYSFQTPPNDFSGSPYIGLGELQSQDQWDFEFDCVAYADDGADSLVCGAADVCDTTVNPPGAQASVALRNGYPDPPSLLYTITNAGSSEISFTVAETDADGTPTDYAWLQLDTPGGGPLPPGGWQDVYANIVDTGLAGGTYTAYITFVDTCGLPNRHVRRIDLTIIDCAAEVWPETEVARSVAVGAAGPLPDVAFVITNTGRDGWTYQVEKIDLCPWLALNKTGGGPLANGQSDIVTAGVQAAGLPEGTHTCGIRFRNTTPDCTNTPPDLIRHVILRVLGPAAAQQVQAEFTVFEGADNLAVSPVEPCAAGETYGGNFLVTFSDVGLVPPGWLTQGTIDGVPGTARFYDPPGSATRGRARFAAQLPFDERYDPTKGLSVAWRMRIANYAPVRGPVQITLPSVAGPFDTELPAEQVFNAYLRLQNGNHVDVLNNSGTVYGGIETEVLPVSLANEYHQWTVSACYNPEDEMAYWNLWIDGAKIVFGGPDGGVTGPGGVLFSFRTPHNAVTGPPYIGLGELATQPSNGWDFEFDWVRVLSWNTPGCPYWDGEGCLVAPACHHPPQDTDGDGDVDVNDFAEFQICFNGASRPPAGPDAALCGCLDADDDADVDVADFAVFQACFNGSNRPAPQPTCDEANAAG